MLRKFFVSLVLCLIAVPCFAANKETNTAKVAAKPAAKVEAKADTETAVEEDANTQRVTKNVAVKEMPANADGETAIRNVAVPQDVLGGFRNAEKPSVKDKGTLPSLPKPGFFGSLAIAGAAWIALEIVKWFAVSFAAIYLLRHLFPNLAIRRDTRNAKLRKATGIKAIGNVDEAVKAFDSVVGNLKDIHASHSKQAGLAHSRLSRLVPEPAPAPKKKVRKTSVPKTS